MGATSRNGVRPEELSEAESRVYELARQTMPLAEIAVRLGVPIAEAERRIVDVCARLGVADRAALQEGAGEREGESAETQDGASEPPKHGRGISRRAVLIGAGVAGGLAAGGAVAGLLLRGGGDTPGASPAPNPSPRPSVTPPASPTPDSAFAKIEPAPDAWEKRLFAPDEAIDWTTGIFFMDVESGAIEGWRVRESAANDDPLMLGFGSRAFGDIITAQGQNRGFVYHRRSERSWSWPGQELKLVRVMGEELLFEELDEGAAAASGTSQESGRYRVLRMADLAEKAQFSVAGTPWASANAPYDERSRRLAIWAGGRDGDRQQLHLLDTDTWKEVAVFDLPPPVERWAPYAAETQMLPGHGTLMVRISYHEPGEPPKPSVPKPPDIAFALPLAGDWSPAAIRSIGAYPIMAWSPNTPDRVSERYVREDGGIGEGGPRGWAALTVENDSGVRFHLLSASLLYSDVEFVRWLPDGSGFTALVDSGATEGNGWDRIAFAVVSAADGKVTRFELPPAAGDEWYQRLSNRGPVPHPSNPDLFSFGRLELHNRRTGKWLRANLGGPGGPGHIDPWSGRENEMVLSLPHGGHGGLGIPALIVPKVVQQLPKEPLTFRVARAGDCLNLREEPSTSAKVLDCLPDGTALTLLDLPLDEQGYRPPSMVGNDDGAWVYVAVAESSRTKGWVSSAYLDWA